MKVSAKRLRLTDHVRPQLNSLGMRPKHTVTEQRREEDVYDFSLQKATKLGRKEDQANRQDKDRARDAETYVNRYFRVKVTNCNRLK